MPVVRNLTPFDLIVSAERYGTPVFDAPAFGTVDVHNLPPSGPPVRRSTQAAATPVATAPMDRIYLQRRGGDLEWPMGAVWLPPLDQTASITVDHLRSSTKPGRAFARRRTFENRTTDWVDVTVAAHGTSTLATLGPGDRFADERPSSEVWVVRSAFSNEVVCAFMDDDDPERGELSYQITDDYQARLAKHAPLPSPLPGGKPVVLITGERELLPLEDRTYIAIEDRNGVMRDFNGQENATPRRVKVVGAKLIWNADDDNYGLMSLQGDKIIDLERLEMIADEVVIRSPLRFPGTHVSITARKVEFRGDAAMVDTRPPEVPAPTFETPDDVNELKDYEAVDGEPGLPGGAVTLIAHKLITGKPGKIRIRTRGGAGGEAERGGLLAYARPVEDAPDTVTPEGSADRAVLNQADIASALRRYFPVTTAGKLDGWWWPGFNWEPEWCFYMDDKLWFDGDPKRTRVTSLRISAHDDGTYFPDTTWCYFPTAPDKAFVQSGRRDMKPYTEHRSNAGDCLPSSPRPVPGNGADAYSGGQPGDGGDAGAVTTNAEHADAVKEVSDVKGGDPGPETAAAPGSEPGAPKVALLVDMAIVLKPPSGSRGREPKVWIEEYRAQPGKSYPARIADPGKNGDVRTEQASWLRVEAIDAVLAFARAAFRNGHREAARRAIEPYYVVLRNGGASDGNRFAAQSVALAALRENLVANVDYYGNPPGWLPRLRVSTNLKLFDAIRLASYQLLFYATTTEQKFDDLSHRRGLVNEVRSALEVETTACRKALADAYQLLATARSDLNQIANKIGQQQESLEHIKYDAEAEAMSVADRQRLYKGVMQVIGGSLQAIPVGQPYLGAGGDLLSGIGNVDMFVSKNGAKQAKEVLAKLGAATDSFLDEHSDLMSEDLTSRHRGKADRTKKETESLGELVTQANGAAKQIEANIAEYMEPIADKRLQDLKARRSGLAAKHEEIAAAIAEFKTGEDVEAVAAEVPRPPSPKTASSREDLRQLAASIREVDKDFAELSKRNDAKNADRLVRLRVQRGWLDDAVARTKAFEMKQAAAEAHVEKLEERATNKQERYAAAMERLKGIGKGIAGVGAGISTLATPIARDDQVVQGLAATLLKTKDPKRYQDVMKTMEELGKEQRAAIETLAKAKSIINANVARIAESLAAQHDLGRQLNNVDNALDARAKQCLQGMRQRAEDMFHSSMYHLVMSYRYEYLEDLPDSFVNYDRVVSALQRVHRATPAKRTEKPTTLTDAVEGMSVDMADPDADKLAELDALVLDFEWLKLGVNMVKNRQHHADDLNTSTLKLALTSDQLQKLTKLRKVTFSLVEDFGYAGDYEWPNARIVDIGLDAVLMETPDEIVNARLEFHHSGESLIKSSRGSVYYYFRAAYDDDPISWNFGLNRTIDPDESPPVLTVIKRDAKSPVDDDVLAKGLKNEKIEFEEYWPSFFSALTLTFDPGLKAKIDAITKLTFHVEFAIPKKGTTSSTGRLAR